MNLIKNKIKPVVLVILDGFGIAPSWGGNAITQSKMTNLFKAQRERPSCPLHASGEYVGLPDSEEGNSEVGHLNIGSGIALEQNLKRINQSIDSEQFFSNQVLVESFIRARNEQKSVHILGIMSHGGVHGDLNHLYALLKMAKAQNCSNVKIHLFTDGRDAPPFQAHIYMNELESMISNIGIGQICSVVGRYYAMDRDRRWDRTEKVYNLLTQGIGILANNADSAISDAYKNGFSDEFIPPYTIRTNRSGGTINDGDSIIFYNFREDRARQLTESIISNDFTGFKRHKVLNNLFFVTFVRYSERLNTQVAFTSQKIQWPLARILSQKGLKQLHLAETEKYAHVTYFFDGGNEKPFNGEDRILIPSPKVSTYDKAPLMSAPEITSVLLKKIDSDKYDFIVVNYANPDMVGHSGNISATVTALNYLDSIIKELIDKVLEKQGVLIITSDHGNCEEMINTVTGESSTDHTDNLIPFILITNKYKELILKNEGKLSDIAPTILELFNIPKPTVMTGTSLIAKSEKTDII